MPHDVGYEALMERELRAILHRYNSMTLELLEVLRRYSPQVPDSVLSTLLEQAARHAHDEVTSSRWDGYLSKGEIQ